MFKAELAASDRRWNQTPNVLPTEEQIISAWGFVLHRMVWPHP